MLIIVRRFKKKPKYYPVAKANIWVVNETDTNRTVFGPKDLNSCQRYIKEQGAIKPKQHMEVKDEVRSQQVNTRD